MFKRLFAGRSGTGGTPAPAVPVQITVALAPMEDDPALDVLLIRPPEDDILRGLESWSWIGLTGLTAIAVSAFGEPFFRTSDGSILHLDTLDGALTPVAASLPDFTALLRDEELRGGILLDGLVLGARDRGLALAPGESYEFRIPPALGGAMDLDHLQKLSFVVKLNLAGQLHEQIRDKPPGTPIIGFKIVD